MEEEFDILGKMLSEEHGLNSSGASNRYQKGGLEFNPFPKSGTANIVGGDGHIHLLGPVDENVHKGISKYIIDSLYSKGSDPEDKFLSGVIVGDYGSGKTQLLMYVRFVLAQAVNYKGHHRNPYVVYIDNPGVKLSELIGGIISKIGEENFRKYLWNGIIKSIRSNESYRATLRRFNPVVGLFGEHTESDPYADVYTISYKIFLENWISGLAKTKQVPEFKNALKQVILDSMKAKFHDATVVEYFYDLVSSDYSSNKTWEVLSQGSATRLDKKYVEIINAVVSLVKEEGYTDFFILVDEFEDLTKGRLNKSQIDNYFYNLRTLVDHQRQWCLLFAMTGNALETLKIISPPLADRIGSRVINIPNLTTDQASRIVVNYLNMAREKSDSLAPFSLDAIENTLEISNGKTRIFLRNCYELIERFTSEQGVSEISHDFVNTVLEA